jgi:hypothetical protein
MPSNNFVARRRGATIPRAALRFALGCLMVPRWGGEPKKTAALISEKSATLENRRTDFGGAHWAENYRISLG